MGPFSINCVSQKSQKLTVEPQIEKTIKPNKTTLFYLNVLVADTLYSPV